MSNQVVIVTGAGGGIGDATARALAHDGASVLLADHDENAVRALADELAATGADVRPLGLDVTDETAVAAAVTSTVEHWGRVDGLVTCAATMIATPLVETSLDDWNRVLGVNATGTFLACKHVVTAFRERGEGGAIVNLSSISGTVALPNQLAYCASKGAVLQLSRQIAVQYAAERIRCNVVSPGSVATDQLATYLGAQPDPQAARAQLIAAHPVARLADPDEIARAITYLLGPGASFITGADIPVDGGYTTV